MNHVLLDVSGVDLNVSEPFKFQSSLKSEPRVALFSLK